MAERLKLGTRVRITSDRLPEALKASRWDATGEVLRHHIKDHGGLTYKVRHDSDNGSIGYYEPHELRVLVRGFVLQGRPRTFFRVYGPNHSEDHNDFTDYENHHDDLEVEIIGEFDFFSYKDGGHVFDHSKVKPEENP